MLNIYWKITGKLLDCIFKLGDDCNIISFKTNNIPMSVIIQLLRYTNIDISLDNYWKFLNIYTNNGKLLERLNTVTK